MSVYDKGLYRVYKNRIDKQIGESCSVEHAIEKLAQPLSRRKSVYIQIMHKKLQKTGKPVCTNFGIINPPKLDISNLRRDRGASNGNL